MGHIYFGEDAEMECDGAAAAQAAGPLAAAGVGGAAPPGWRTQPAQQPLRCGACCSRARVSFNDADPTYVFKAARSPDCTTVAASLSNNAIKWYSLANAQLAHGGSFSKAHTNTITDVQFPVAAAPHALYSCSRDGALKGWDLRSKAPAERCGGCCCCRVVSGTRGGGLLAAVGVSCCTHGSDGGWQASQARHA
jgi:WD40 repeat protein